LLDTRLDIAQITLSQHITLNCIGCGGEIPHYLKGERNVQKL